MRLQKYLARAGVGSRRACEEVIRAGRVRVNGIEVRDPAYPVDAGRDRVAVDGRDVRAEPLVYVALHKPRGLVSTARDPFGRPTVVDHVRRTGGPRLRLYPVGRLDADSEGLLLLTNDGELAYLLTHPSREVKKTYRVTVRGHVGDAACRALEAGVMLEDGPTAPAEVRVLHRRGGKTVLEITVHEGRKRQVRRMCEAVGHPVLRLVRVRIGSLQLGGLPPGSWRLLSPREVAALKACAAPAGRGKAGGRP